MLFPTISFSAFFTPGTTIALAAMLVLLQVEQRYSPTLRGRIYALLRCGAGGVASSTGVPGWRD